MTGGVGRGLKIDKILGNFHMGESVKGLLLKASGDLAASGVENAPLEASLLLAHAMGLKREVLLLEPDKIPKKEEVLAFSGYIERRKKHEPIAYIIGKKEFWSLDFQVSRATLIPRPDSETLVEAALVRASRIAQKQDRPLNLLNIRILDIGTGTACLLISLLKELPEAQGVGVDISEDALNIAKQNAQLHGVIDRITLMQSNWCQRSDGKFDLIISNPPYIASGELPDLMQDVTGYEPHGALFSGIDGMDSYRAISKQLYAKLNTGGYALFEVGKGQADTVAGYMGENGLEVEEIVKDLAGIQRCVVARKDK